VYSVVNGTCFTPKLTVGGPTVNLGVKQVSGPTVHLEVKQVTFATLCTQPPDDGLQMGPKHVEAW
jgi:hypothetical protein